MKIEREFTQNDIYFMEVVSDKIVINDNYQGIIVLNGDLNICASIKLFEDIIFDSSYVKEKVIILYCYENRCFVHFNIETFAYKIIKLKKEFYDISFLPLYEWSDNELFLLVDDGKFIVKLSLMNYELEKIDKSNYTDTLLSIYNDWRKISPLIVHKIYSERRTIIIEDDNNLKLMNYNSGDIKHLDIKRIDFYGVETNKSCVLQVSETEIFILYGEKSTTFYPKNKGYRFLSCKYLDVNGVEDVLFLSSSNADSSLCKIQIYNIDQDLFS